MIQEQFSNEGGGVFTVLFILMWVIVFAYGLTEKNKTPKHWRRRKH